MRPEKLVICGDFNIHVDDSSRPDVTGFTDVLDEYGLQQVVQTSTHRRGHVLDLVITRRDNNIIVSGPTVHDITLSDHYPVVFDVTGSKPRPPVIRSTGRDYRGMDDAAFEEDLHLATAATLDSTFVNIDELCSNYNTAASQVLDQHVPLVTRKRIMRQSCPWVDDHLVDLRAERRLWERKWRKSRLTVHREILEAKTSELNDYHNSAKREYFADVLSSRDKRTTFRALNSLLKDDPQPLPESNGNLSDDFLVFFNNKIDTIMSDIDAKRPLLSGNIVPLTRQKPVVRLSTFPIVEDQLIKQIINTAPSKSCQLDVTPTWLLKRTLDHHLPVMTQIINTSLTTGVVPDCFKEAIVIPLLKKSTLDSSVLSNYRPVSNLTFLSKVTEKVVLRTLNDHLESNDLCDAMQSAYKTNHSTETALLRMHHDLSMFLDRGKAALVVLLDLSAAFDTISHCRLIDALESSYGITGTALSWFRSYLANRRHRVSTEGRFSEFSTSNFGVPQGSVLGPVLFSIYTQPLSDIIESHNILYHKYADDITLYIAYDPTNPDETNAAKAKVQRCVEDIAMWMTMNYLMLNSTKTELLNVISVSHMRKYGRQSLDFDGTTIHPSNTVKCLGVIIDQHLSMSHQVSAVVKSCYYYIRNIGKVRRFLTDDACKQAVATMVTSRLDYCSSLLSGVSKRDLRRLQKVQNSAARLVSRSSADAHITPVLGELHWLPCELRFQFRLLVLVYKCLNNNAPAYLEDLITVYVPRRTLRSSQDGPKLVATNTNKKIGEQAFGYSAPNLWNRLPVGIRTSTSLASFKGALKFHYFVQYFGNV